MQECNAPHDARVRMAVIGLLRAGDLPLFKLNFRIITLLPKKEDANRIEQYRVIDPFAF